MSNIDEDTSKEWLAALEKKLREEKRDKIRIPYSNISLAFPGGPHSASFDIQRIDSDIFKKWAKNLAWNVELDTKTHLEFPDVIFTRISRQAIQPTP